MKTGKFLQFVLGFMTAGLLAAGSLAIADGDSRQKVVYHINDLDRANAALRNVTNHLNAVGDENVDLVVVTHSKGGFALVDGSRDSAGNGFEAAIAALSNRGVRFQLCENTIEGMGIDRNNINLVAEVVPSGVAQVAALQHQGYVYIKP